VAGRDDAAGCGLREEIEIRARQRTQAGRGAAAAPREFHLDPLFRTFEHWRGKDGGRCGNHGDRLLSRGVRTRQSDREEDDLSDAPVSC